MAATVQVPTVAEVRKHSFGRATIAEALQECFGVDVNGRTAAKALKAQLVQLIEGQMPGIGDAAGAQHAVQRAPRGWTAPGTRLSSGLCYAACRLANAKQKLDGWQQLRIAIVQFLTQGRNSTCPNDHAGHSLLALYVAPIMLRQVHAGRECMEANWPFCAESSAFLPSDTKRLEHPAHDRTMSPNTQLLAFLSQ